jgi:hypothetical protein
LYFCLGLLTLNAYGRVVCKEPLLAVLEDVQQLAFVVDCDLHVAFVGPVLTDVLDGFGVVTCKADDDGPELLGLDPAGDVKEVSNVLTLGEVSPWVEHEVLKANDHTASINELAHNFVIRALEDPCRRLGLDDLRKLAVALPIDSPSDLLNGVHHVLLHSEVIPFCHSHSDSHGSHPCW